MEPLTGDAHRHAEATPGAQETPGAPTGPVNSTTAGGGAPAGGALFDVMAGAADILHRPGPVGPKFDWTVRAVRFGTGARSVAYLAIDERLSVRAVAGSSSREIRALVRGSARPIVDRARETHRSVHAENALGGETEPPFVVVPVPRSPDSLHGLILLILDDPDDPERAARMAGGLALHLGVALDNVATIAQLAELEAAQREVVTQLQEAVRPPRPDVEHAELGVHYEPADPDAPTGGDLYDWHLLPGGDLHLAVVDVAGKGVQATKEALAVTHTIRLLALEECPMEELVARADRIVGDSHPGLTATLVVARYSPASGRLRLAGAGHPPALLVTREGAAKQVDVPGVPIGWPDAGSVRVLEETLGRDQSLVLYTDGLIETSNDVIAGIGRLEEAASEIARYPAHFLARSLVERALVGAARRDDALALVLRHRVADMPHRRVLGPFHYRFSPSTASIPLTRHLFADWLHYQPVDPAHRDDLLFVATELCTNGIRASSGAPQSVELRAWLDGAAIHIQVEDDGAGFVPAPSTDLPATDSESGRGLFLVRALTDRVDVARVDANTVTMCVKDAVIVDDRSESGG